MGAIYQISGPNIGKDVSVLITDSQGNSVAGAQLGIMTHFSVKPEYNKVQQRSIINNGQTFVASWPHIYLVTLKFSRYNSALEDLEAFYASNAAAGIQLEYVIQYMTQNRSGGMNVQRVTGCVPTEWDFGEYSEDRPVPTTVAFEGTKSSQQGANTGLF